MAFEKYKPRGLFSEFYGMLIMHVIAELHARAKRVRGRSPIAKVIYPSQKIW